MTSGFPLIADGYEDLCLPPTDRGAGCICPLCAAPPSRARTKARRL